MNAGKGGIALDNRKRYISLGLTLLLHANNHAMFSMLMPLGTTLKRYFGFADLSPVALGFTMYLFLYGFGQIPIGFLSDRMSRKTLLAAGAVLNGIAIALVAAFPNYTFFLVGMTVAGIGAAAYHPVNASYVSDLFRKSRGTALGLSGIGATVGLFFGPLASGYLCESIGWKVTFLIFSAISVIVDGVFMIMAMEPEREKFQPGDPGGGWGRGLIIFLAIAATIFTLREFAGWGGYFLIPVFSETIYGYSIAYAGTIGALQTVGGFIAQPLGGYLSDRFGRRVLMSFFLFFCALFMILIPFGGKRFLVTTVLLYGFMYTATVPIIDALIADRTPGHIRGAVFGLFMASGIGISSFSQFIQAKIIDASAAEYSGFLICFIMLGACVFLSMVVMLLFRGAEEKNVV
ncbi:MFS transporter [bacterium]